MRHLNFAIGVIAGVALAAAMAFSIFTAQAQTTFLGPVMTSSYADHHRINANHCRQSVAPHDPDLRYWRIQWCLDCTGRSCGSQCLDPVIGTLDIGRDLLHIAADH